MAADALLVGIDLGTTGTRAALYTESGEALAEATAETPLRWHGPAHVDQDPDDFYAATARAVAECMERSGADPVSVEGVGVTGQMAGVLGIDSDWRPSIPYDSWLDMRCSADVEHLEREVGDLLVERTGCPPMVNHAPKIRWWARERPEAFARTASFVMPGGYVAGRLAGLGGDGAFIDRTYLHFTGLADAARGEWSGELADAVGVPAEKLPRIVEPATTVGALAAGPARDLGLREGTPVAAGLGDTAAGALGAAIVRPGQLLDTAGTAAVLAASTSEHRPDRDERTLIVMRGALPGQWIALSYLSAGSLLEWVGDLLFGGDERPDLGELAGVAERAPAGADGLVFVPHVDGRILPSRPELRGAWVGLGRDHRREHLVRAVLEGVAYEYAGYLRVMRRLHPELEFDVATVIGGGARSATWNQVKSSVLGLPYVRLDREEFSCWGAALVAGAAVGAFDDLAAAAAAASPERERTDPRAQDTVLYEELVSVYSELVEGLADPSRGLVSAARRAPG